METANKTRITVSNTVNAPVNKVWKLWTLPEHITKWNNASKAGRHCISCEFPLNEFDFMVMNAGTKVQFNESI